MPKRRKESAETPQSPVFIINGSPTFEILIPRRILIFSYTTPTSSHFVIESSHFRQDEKQRATKKFQARRNGRTT
jgi:hypothetical protein